jgi:hypothetical protein
MLLFRWALLLLLVASAVSFALYAGTGQARFRQLGLRLLKWALTAGFVFFAVLILERIA